MKEQKDKRKSRPHVYAMSNELCVWAQAQVIKPTKCLNAFNCLNCSVDRQVLANFEQKKKAEGVVLNRSPRMMLLMNQGKCRHMLSGRVSYSLCAHGYNCVKCPYDQMIEDASYLPSLKPPTVDQTSGFYVAQDHYYHHGHTWARVEYGGRVRVGIDDFALRLFGTQDEIEVPKLGATVGQGRPKAVLRRSGHEAETLSPVDGKVVAINYKVVNRTQTANDSPFGDGWLMVIEPTALRRNLKNLFFGDESMAWIDEEADRLRALLGEETGYQMAATGGEAIGDIYGMVPGVAWDRLADAFLR